MHNSILYSVSDATRTSNQSKACSYSTIRAPYTLWQFKFEGHPIHTALVSIYFPTANDPVMIPIHKTRTSHKYAKVLCDQRFSVHIYPTNQWRQHITGKQKNEISLTFDRMKLKTSDFINSVLPSNWLFTNCPDWPVSRRCTENVLEYFDDFQKEEIPFTH